MGEARCVVHDAVEPLELRLDGLRHVFEVAVAGLLQIQRQDRGLRVPRGLDFVVHRFQSRHVASVQDDGGAVAREGQSRNTPNSAARPGDKNDASV